MKSITEIYKVLLKTYGKQNWWPADSSFEVCVGAVLTQNTNWKNVEKAIKNLKEKKLLSAEKILSCSFEELKELIKPAGFFRQKAQYLKNLSRFTLENGGLEKLKRENTENLRRELLKVKGIGKETADSILLYALDKPTFVVDTYTKRFFNRLGLIESENVDYEIVKKLVESEIPPVDRNLEIYKELHALIVEHSKTKCRKKPNCKNCPFSLDCSTLENKTRFLQKQISSEEKNL